MAQRANITDRAKRYRAQRNVTGPRACVVCGSTSDLGVMHLTGNEDDGEKANLAYGCRSCNGKLAAAFKTLKLGRPTNQYNPAKSTIPTFEQYMWAVSSGAREYYPSSTRHAKGVKDEAGAIIHATPKHKRIEYSKRIAKHAARSRREKDSDRWNPAADWTMARFGAGSTEYQRAKLHAERLKADGVKVTPIKKESTGRYWFKYRYAVANPAESSAEVFEEFHGFAPSEVVTVTKKQHYHKHLAAAGKLTHLDVWGIDDQGHKITGFRGALLAFNESKNQLFIEGGDQKIDLTAYGIDAPHELETLGRLTDIGYQTNKTHLGDEGGEAVYVHKFRSTNVGGRHVIVKIARYPDLIYDDRNEQLLLSGGSYEILREGINK